MSYYILFDYYNLLICIINKNCYCYFVVEYSKIVVVKKTFSYSGEHCLECFILMLLHLPYQGYDCCEIILYAFTVNLSSGNGMGLQ